MAIHFVLKWIDRNLTNRKINTRTAMATVSIIKTTYADLRVDKLLDPLGGMGRFVEKGEKVLLKVNLLSARKPDEAVTTHPELVRAVAEAVRNAGGVPYIGDSPARMFLKKNLKKAYKESGLLDFAAKDKISLNYDTGTEKMEIPNGVRLKRSPICRYILDADKIISLPKLKTHSMQYLTLACKNMYGAVPGLVKANYHARFPSRAAFADMLLDILIPVRPHLVIMDGILGMHGQGPANGSPIQLEWTMASTNSIAIDIAVCMALGIEPVGIPILKKAKIRKLWPKKIDYPLLKPEEITIRGFKLPNTAEHLLTGKTLSIKHPVVNDKCIGCGDCEQICPKGAVTVDGGVARILYSKCIRCYCCHEVCPENAIKLAGKKDGAVWSRGA
ncbi:DUF362 domain-containing protein [Thermodesulfobacteriota bacterium]